MGIKTHVASVKRNNGESLSEKLYREERNYRADRLVEKWSRVPEIGKGIKDLSAGTARNLSILLENQTRQMKKMTEAQISANFFGYTPENMLRLIRLSYPNSIRGDLFTEFAMETSHDSIKYVEPVYTNAQRNDFDWDLNQPKYSMDNRFDDVAHNHDVMYESTESRYATELVNVNASNFSVAANQLKIDFKGVAGDEALANYIPGSSVLYVVVDGQRQAIALQGVVNGFRDGSTPTGSKTEWFGGKDVCIAEGIYLQAVKAADAADSVTFGFKVKNGATGAYKDATVTKADEVYTIVDEDESFSVEVGFAAIGRYDSERDLTGKYLGEVELQMRDYHFRPRPISLGVTWTELTELVLDTSFGVSAEEMLMDSAAQEIKKTLDFQAVKYASNIQKVYASENFVQFDAEAPDGTGNIKDSYWHTAQIINQAIGHVEDNMLNEFNRGGVTAIVGGPKACRYLELNEGWTNKGAQPKIGGHKVGELNGIPVFKVPSSIIPDDQLVTTWKNDQAEGDVAIAIGTLLPFYSTGALQRKNLYKEGAIARFEDMQALQPKYLGRIQINHIR